MSNNHLYEAYNQIRSLYEKENYSPGILTKLGCVSKWVTIDATKGQSGMAFNFSGGHAVYGTEEPQKLLSLQPFVGKDLFTLTEYLLQQEHIMLRAASVATLNALSCPLTAHDAMQKRGIPLGQEEDYAFIRPDDVVAVVGYGRVVGHLANRNIPYHVLDMRPIDSLGYWSIGDKVDRGPECVTFHNIEETEKVLSQADILFITGCTLVNGTFKSLIDQAKKTRIIALFGPSASILPEYLLDSGVNYVLSSRCTDKSGIFHGMINFDGRRSIKGAAEDYIIQAF